MTDTLEPAAPAAAETAAPFEPGDPRAGPFTPAEIAEAELYAKEPGRWHKDNHAVDWFAVRLQYGRGMTMAGAASLFGISERRIYRRKSEHKWSPRMTERDRRSLSRLVWLAGESRLAPDDAEGRRMLAAASEWRLVERPDLPRWQPQDPDGEPLRFKLGDHWRG